MKLTNLSNVLTDMRGEDVTWDDKGEEKKLRVRDVLSFVVASGFDRPEQVDLARLFDLSNKIYNGADELEVSSEQIEYINKCLKSHRWETRYSAYLLGEVVHLTGIEVADKKQKK